MLIQFFTSNLIWTEGLYILLATLGIVILGWFFWRPLLYTGLVFLLFSLYFFRNPERVCPPEVLDGSSLVCPADGRVVEIVDNLADNAFGFTQRVSIFLSPLDVHVTRSPCTAHVQKITYVPGTFVMAFLPKSSELNEHNDVLLVESKGRKILVRQIAGILARRISCWTSEGDSLKCGEPFGIIRFGSRVDVFLPDTVHINIHLDQYVYGGETLLGSWT